MDNPRSAINSWTSRKLRESRKCYLTQVMMTVDSNSASGKGVGGGKPYRYPARSAGATLSISSAWQH